MFTVDIVMSVFNGEEFLQEQLDSIGKQTFSDWKLIVRNNGSRDRTASILQLFSKAYPGKVEIIEAGVTEPFIPLSFGDALSRSTAPYVMYADGDDVWMADKIEVTLTAMRGLQTTHGPRVPLLVHTDLVLVDRSLNKLSNSMWKSQALNPDRKRLNQVIMHSNACGNTFLFNAELRELVLPIPKGCIMHDYWTTTIAAAFGYIEPVSKATILYRQHERNTCGGTALNISNIIRKASQVSLLRARLNEKYQFAQLFLNRFRSRLNPEYIEMLDSLSSFPKRNWLVRRVLILRFSFFQSSLVRNIGMLIIS